MNPMQKIRVEKITLNIGVGNDPDKLSKALKLLEKITGQKPVKTFAKKRIPTFGIRPGLPIGAKVTLRGERAMEVLKKLLVAKDNRLSSEAFDDQGNFSFGIEEYIEIPGMKYDPEIGVMGLEIAVTLERPGYRIKRRRIKSRKLPNRIRITKEDAIKFAQEELGVKVE